MRCNGPLNFAGRVAFLHKALLVLLLVAGFSTPAGPSRAATTLPAHRGAARRLFCDFVRPRLRLLRSTTPTLYSNARPLLLGDVLPSTSPTPWSEIREAAQGRITDIQWLPSFDGHPEWVPQSPWRGAHLRATHAAADAQCFRDLAIARPCVQVLVDPIRDASTWSRTALGIRLRMCNRLMSVLGGQSLNRCSNPNAGVLHNTSFYVLTSLVHRMAENVRRGLPGEPLLPVRPSGGHLARPGHIPWRTRLCLMPRCGTQGFYFEEIRVFQAGACIVPLSME